ncbi:hypothetical protein O6H91_14G021800 [Diphasiastrum complanatum]|uniref:Uncharacterized protein n=1 Tax=Diphasiastrum complanatum TaxID=34168 RepID=A0ACC2BM82_DIPCM|nr:hypothetical protein O6H91_14G021800 [Diphasiastrum complanatum]
MQTILVTIATTASRGSKFCTLSWMLIILLLLSLQVRLTVAAQPSAHEKLKSYGFPAGLLPDTVVDYSLQEDGSFVVHLRSKCAVTLRKTYHVAYSSTITGMLESGSLKGLTGINVKAFKVWWLIRSIRVSNNNLIFEVGIMSAKFPVENFIESPGCSKVPLVTWM